MSGIDVVTCFFLFSPPGLRPSHPFFSCCRINHARMDKIVVIARLDLIARAGLRLDLWSAGPNAHSPSGSGRKKHPTDENEINGLGADWRHHSTGSQRQGVLRECVMLCLCRCRRPRVHGDIQRTLANLAFHVVSFFSLDPNSKPPDMRD